MGVGTSLFLIAVGALLTFAVEVDAEGLNLDAVGVILMIVGVVGLIASMIYWNSWGRLRPAPPDRRRRPLTSPAHFGVRSCRLPTGRTPDIRVPRSPRRDAGRCAGRGCAGRVVLASVPPVVEGTGGLARQEPQQR